MGKKKQTVLKNSWK